MCWVTPAVRLLSHIIIHRHAPAPAAAMAAPSIPLGATAASVVGDRDLSGKTIIVTGGHCGEICSSAATAGISTACVTGAAAASKQHRCHPLVLTHVDSCSTPRSIQNRCWQGGGPRPGMRWRDRGAGLPRPAPRRGSGQGHPGQRQSRRRHAAGAGALQLRDLPSASRLTAAAGAAQVSTAGPSANHANYY